MFSKTNKWFNSRSMVWTEQELPRLFLTNKSVQSEASTLLKRATTLFLRLSWWIGPAQELQSTSITTVWAPRSRTLDSWTEWVLPKSCLRYRSTRNCKCSTKDAKNRWLSLCKNTTKRLWEMFTTSLSIVTRSRKICWRPRLSGVSIQTTWSNKRGLWKMLGLLSSIGLFKLTTISIFYLRVFSWQSTLSTDISAKTRSQIAKSNWSECQPCWSQQSTRKFTHHFWKTSSTSVTTDVKPKTFWKWKRKFCSLWTSTYSWPHATGSSRDFPK